MAASCSIFWSPQLPDRRIHSMPLTIADLARTRKIPAAFLEAECRLQDSPQGVQIPYFDQDGSEPVLKLRTHQEARKGSRWPQDTRLLPYGLWRLHDARRRETLILVEGETDCWALWHMGYPALGLPGCDGTNCLEAEHLSGVEVIYLHQEPDQGGERFVANLSKRLRALRFKGRVFVFSLPGVKDPSQLLADRGEAAARTVINRAFEEARPVDWFDKGDAHEGN